MKTLFEFSKVYSGDKKIIKEFMKKNGFSKPLIRRVKENGRITVNGESKRNYESIDEGDLVKISIENDELDTIPEHGDFNLIFENENYMVVDKPPFISTHESRRYPNKTLANFVADYLLKKGFNAKIRFVNRLDKDTSGIVVISKNLYSHEFIQKQMREQSVGKEYIAVLQGRLKNKFGAIDTSISRIKEGEVKRISGDQGESAYTEYEVMGEIDGFTKVLLRPKTGRTHQLRVHTSSLGAAIVGDSLYGQKSNLIERQALHAHSISFIEPITNKKVTYKAQLPSDIRDLIENLNSAEKK